MFYSKGRLAIATGAIALFIAAAAIYTHLEKEVTIKVDDKVEETTTFSDNVEDLLREKNIKLAPEDVVIPGVDKKVKDNMTIVIKRAFPIKISYDGKDQLVRTQPDKVKNILRKADISLSEKDKTIPALDEFVKNDTTIQVIRVEEKVDTKVNTIPYKTITRKDSSLPVGTTKVIQQGEEGKEKIITTYSLENGETVSKKTNKILLKSSKPKIVLMGSMNVATRGGTKFSYSRKMRMMASAYTYTGNRTASGTTTRKGVVAVDPSVIPMGSKLYIEGYGFARAEDTGGAIKGNKIDVFLPSYSEAKRYGRRWVTVYILK